MTSLTTSLQHKQQHTLDVCLCEQQADLTQPDFIPIHTHCWLVLCTLQVQLMVPFISCMIALDSCQGLVGVFFFL